MSARTMVSQLAVLAVLAALGLAHAGAQSLTHVAAPRQTGTQLVSALNSSAAGHAQLVSAGVVTASGALQQASASDGWPAQFDLSLDATKSLSAGIVVGAKTVAATYEHRRSTVDWDNAGLLAVTWDAGAPSVSVLSLGPLPAGWYVLALNLHVDGTLPSSTKVQFSDAFATGTCTLSTPDAQGVTPCIALMQIRAATTRDQFLLGLLGSGQARFLGMTLSRVHQ